MNYSIADISEQLSHRVEDVCQFLLPHGKKSGDKWEVGGTDGSPGMSCKIQLTGDHAGKWKDWANDADRGDLIDLWQSVTGKTRIETMREVKDYLGIHDSVSGPREKKYAPPPESEKIKALSANGKAMQYLATERKIEPKTANLFKIQGDGESIIYPYYTLNGELVNRCYIKLERENGKKIIRRDKGCAPCLWGWQALTEETFTARKILIVEGQIDAMTWTQWGIPALSVPNGSDMTWIDYEWEHLEMFSEIFLSFDMDGAGKENLRKAMNRLGLHRCRIVKLPYKDANEALKSGFTAEQAKEALAKSEYPQYEGLVPALKYYDATMEEFYPNPNKPKGFKPLMLQRFDGGMEFLPGDVTVWSGISSHGKTALLTYLTLLATVDKKKAMVASLEMRPELLISRMFRSVMRKPVLNETEIEECFLEMAGKLFFADKIGYIDKKTLLDMMLFAFSRYGADHIVIDSLMRVSGLEEDYPAQGDFMNELQAFAKRTGGHVHVVCHPRKTADEKIPGKLDIKGSSLIMNNCDNLIVVHKNMEKEKIRRERQLTDEEDRRMYDAEIVSEKQRDRGWHGRVLLRFCNKTFTFSKFP